MSKVEEKIELLPCPFCGWPGGMISDGPNCITCGRCQADGPFVQCDESAAKEWNRRADHRPDWLSKRLAEKADDPGFLKAKVELLEGELAAYRRDHRPDSVDKRADVDVDNLAREIFLSLNVDFPDNAEMEREIVAILTRALARKDER